MMFPSTRQFPKCAVLGFSQAGALVTFSWVMPDQCASEAKSWARDNGAVSTRVFDEIGEALNALHDHQWIERKAAS